MAAGRRVSWLVCVALAGMQTLTSTQRVAFEVASVRPNRSGDLAIRMDMPGSDRFTATNVPLRDLILFAYDVQSARLLGGPDWIRSERFDVVAKSDRPLPQWGPSGAPAELVQMLRTMLAERFALVVHNETRELPVYALVMVRNDRSPGPNLKPSALECDRRLPGPPPSVADPAQPTCGMRIGPGQMVMGGTPMSRFVTILPSFVQRVVLDRTGLAGTFDFRLSWTPEQGPGGGPPPPGAPALPPVDPNGASIFAALQEQLGLRLEPQQAPLDVVVIDTVERPTAD